ncbi:MAG TPA: NAD(P)H-hydrate dehydratase [Myxococcota bacterium]|nr:NAD(P)H-hydrate dehydratase [Myxococcota bacterium]
MTGGVTRAAWPLVGSARMRALDRHTIETLGVPGEILMESAGRAVAEAALALRGPGAPIHVLCGAGNNGGDGLVAARHLHLVGAPVRVSMLVEGKELRGDAAANWRRARDAGVAIESGVFRAPAGGIVIDAIFGTGLARDVDGPAADAIRNLDAARSAGSGALKVLAVDLPSGLCADTGQERGVCVQADVTLTLGLPKLGLVLEPGRTRAGRILVARIGIADEAPGVVHDAWLWTRAGAAAHLPARPAAGHKGTFGHALVVAGSEGKTGAATLAALGAARVGTGLVTVGCPAGLNDILEIKLTEAMTAPLPDTSARGLAAAAEPAILALAQARDAVGLGPGIGRDAEVRGLVRALAKRIEQPLALDADAILAFEGEPALLKARRAPTVLTPHPGEAAALLGCTAAEINADRPAAARRLAAETGAVALLKGAATIAATPDGRLVVNPTGGPALGSGGTGDVLLGMLTGLLAQGVPAPDAAALAAYVHGAAGDAWSRRSGDAGLLAGDLAAALPEVIASLRCEACGSAGANSLVAAFPER